MLWPLLCTVKSAHDMCVEHMEKSVTSVLFCEGLSLAGEGHLPHSGPLLVSLASNQDEHPDH